MPALPQSFSSRADLVAHVRALCPWAKGEESPIQGGLEAAQQTLARIDPINYGRTRNFAHGAVTRLSPYIRHGLLTLAEVRDLALSKASQPEQITKFIQELAWRDFWQRLYAQDPTIIWRDIEPYKTGFTPDDYADDMPSDILAANTDCAALNAFIRELHTTGYLHNHARMYLAAYVVHFRRIKWQAGARWFLHHLLDGDPASNNLSWQWVASTFSHKPYIFNLENVDKYFGKAVDTSPLTNQPLHASYETLSARLFPQMRPA